MAARKAKFVKGTYFDYPSLFLVLFLAMFGLMMIYSSSSYVANNTFKDGAYYLKRQFFFSLMGIVGMLALSRYRYQRLKKFMIFIMAVQFILLILVIIFKPEGIIGFFRNDPTVNKKSRFSFLGKKEGA